MIQSAFTPKEAQEFIGKLRINPKKKDKEYPEGEEWEKYLHHTVGKNGTQKDQKISYFIIELDGVAKISTLTGKKMLTATLGNHVRTVMSFDTKFYSLIMAQVTAGYYDHETHELSAGFEGYIYEEPTPFEYEQLIQGIKRTMNNVKVICLFDENEKAGTLIGREIERVRQFVIKTQEQIDYENNKALEDEAM